MKLIALIFFVLIIIISSVSSFAGTAQQFQVGLKDVLMSPLQISGNVKTETANSKFLPFALVGGLLKGSFYMVKKIVNGTLVVVTSPLDMIHQ